MQHSFVFLQKILLIITISSIGLFSKGLAQQSIADAKAPILAALELYFNKTDPVIDVVTNFNDHPDFWTIDQLDTHTQSFRISWYHKEHLSTEFYLMKDEKLIYAIEEVKAMRFNHYTQSVWRCEYFIKDDTVIDYQSLGHGKTEDDAWEPEEILTQFSKRKTELKKIRK